MTTNQGFANLLARAIKNGKLNASKTVSNFIEKYGGTADGKFKDEPGEFTAEITSLVKKMRQLRLKIKDSQLNFILNEVIESAPVETKKVETTRSNYRAQEY